MRVRRKRNRAATPRNREELHPLVNPLFAPLCNTNDEERALDNPDERAFYRTALEYRQRLFSPRQQEILVQTARAKFGLAV